MASWNNWTGIGNATRDPVLRYLPSQTPVTDFGIACSRKFKTQAGEEREETLFLDCSAFGKLAEIVNDYVKKGKQIFLSGRLVLDQWDDKQTGQKRTKIKLSVEDLVLLGSREGSGGGGDSGRSERQPSGPPPRQGRPPARTPSGGGKPQQDPDQTFDEPTFQDPDIPFRIRQWRGQPI